MDSHLVFPVLLAFFASAFLKGITGLGFSTICLGLLASFIDLKIAIPLVLIPSLSSNVLVMVQAGRFGEAVRRFWWVYLAALPGLVLGLWVLGSVPSTQARTVLGGVLFVYGAWSLSRAEIVLSARSERWLAGPVGFATGVVNGLTGSQVMPVLPYLLALRLHPDLFVQAINISFTASTLVMFVGLGKLGLLSGHIALLSASGIVPVAAGIWLGGRIRRRLGEAAFRRAVLVALLVIGASLMVRRWLG